jgi:quinol monooxygenase YgiN
MLIVSGRVPVRPERRAEAVAAALKMAAATQAEAGCRSYSFYSDLADPNTFFIYEEWEDEAALTAHFQTPHMAEFNAVIPAFVAGPPSINRYDVSTVAKLM